MKNLCKTLSLLLAVLLFACSCSSKDTNNGHCTFSDFFGKSITLDVKPQKVAVLFSSFADIWLSAGGDVAVTVGETVERGLCSDDVLLVDDGAGKTVNIELLLAYEPDFVIYSADIEAQVKCAEILNSAGIPAAGFKVETFEDYLSVLKIFTDITERADLYKENGLKVQAEVEGFLNEKPYEGKNVLFIRAGSSARSVKAKTSEDNFAAKMITDLGAVNIADQNASLVENLSLEAILQSNPDYIFFASMGDEQASRLYVAQMLKEKGWAELNAVKNGNYCFLPKEMFHYKPNSRWGEAYEYLKNLT